MAVRPPGRLCHHAWSGWRQSCARRWSRFLCFGYVQSVGVAPRKSRKVDCPFLTCRSAQSGLVVGLVVVAGVSNPVRGAQARKGGNSLGCLPGGSSTSRLDRVTRSRPLMRYAAKPKCARCGRPLGHSPGVTGPRRAFGIENAVGYLSGRARFRCPFAA